MLKRILTAVLMLFVLLVVNSAGASNTIRIAYSDIDNFVGIKDGRLAGYGVALFDAIAEHTGWTYEYKSGSWEQCLEWVKNGEADFTFPAQYSERAAGGGFPFQQAELYFRFCCYLYVRYQQRYFISGLSVVAG